MKSLGLDIITTTNVRDQLFRGEGHEAITTAAEGAGELLTFAKESLGNAKDGNDKYRNANGGNDSCDTSNNYLEISDSSMVCPFVPENSPQDIASSHPTIYAEHSYSTQQAHVAEGNNNCLLYTSDAADE